MRSGVINFSSVWTLSLLLDTLGKKSQVWRQGGKRPLKRKVCLNSQQEGPLVISYMMLSSLVKSHGSRRRRVLQKSQWQRALGFRVSLPWASQLRPEAPHTRCTKSSPGPDRCRNTWSVPHIPNFTAGHCELWPLIFKEKETVSWIAASYHCHSCLNLQEQEEMQEPAPTTPASLSTRRSCYTNANLPRHIILRPRFTSVLTESIYNHTGLLLPCLSQLKVGQPGDSNPPFWCRWEVELALMHTELLRRSPGALVTLLSLQVGMAPPATAPSTHKRAHKKFCSRFKRKHHSQLWMHPPPPPVSQK